MNKNTYSFTSAKSWLKQLVGRRPTEAQSIPSVVTCNGITEHFQTSGTGNGEVDVTDRASHSAPESFLHGFSQTHLARLRFFCEKSIGGAFFSSSIGNDDEDDNSSITSITNYFNNINEGDDMTGRQDINMQEIQTTMSMETKDKARCMNYNTQQSVLSADSGIFEDETRINKRIYRSVSQNDTITCRNSADRDCSQSNQLSAVSNRKKCSSHPIIHKQGLVKTLSSCSKFFSIPKHSIKQEFKKKATGIQKKVATAEANGSGCVKVSLQYFKNAKQLRVIVIKANKLKRKARKSEVSLILYTGKTSIAKHTCKKRVKEHEVEFKDEMYFNTDDLTDCSLRIKLYEISKVFRRRKLSGEAVLELHDLDLTLDTTMWINIKAPAPNQIETPVDLNDVLVCTEDRSILAETTASIYGTGDDNALTLFTPMLHRTQSLSLRKFSFSRRNHLRYTISC